MSINPFPVPCPLRPSLKPLDPPPHLAFQVSAHFFCRRCGVHVVHAPDFPHAAVADVNVHCISRSTIKSLAVAFLRGGGGEVPGMGDPVEGMYEVREMTLFFFLPVFFLPVFFFLSHLSRRGAQINTEEGLSEMRLSVLPVCFVFLSSYLERESRGPNNHGGKKIV